LQQRKPPLTFNN